MYSVALTERSTVRTTRHDQDAAAIDDLDAALRELGVPFERARVGDRYVLECLEKGSAPA